MKLYRISQSVNRGYDTYDSAVVCAASEDEARLIRPYWATSKYLYPTYQSYNDSDREYDRTWCIPEHVQVTYLGETHLTEVEVICASFNAG
jgi:hypothetical protein